MPEQNKFLRGQIAWLGFKQAEVLFNRNKRKYKRVIQFGKMLRFAMDGITSFSDKPLQLAIKLGFIMSLHLSSLYAIYLTIC
jgi:dolichol-phosphate mannosyltransferase